MGVADLRTQSPPLAITLGEIKGRTIPRRLRPKATLNQSLRSNFSAERAMAVGWTVAATAGANRRTPCISYPFQPASFRGLLRCLICFSPLTLVAACRAVVFRCDPAAL
jgi:hypothetical protein